MLKELLKIKHNMSLYKDKLKQERVTKNCLIEPFFKVLGYDITDPYAVETEFKCMSTEGKGYRVDYVLKVGDKPVILVEAKNFRSKINEKVITQLKTYFKYSEVDIAVATNGCNYWFFTGEEGYYREMNEVPFYAFDIRDITIQDIEFLTMIKREHFSSLHLESTIYNNSIKPILYKYIKDKLRVEDYELVEFIKQNTGDKDINIEGLIKQLDIELQRSVVLKSNESIKIPEIKQEGVTEFRSFSLTGITIPHETDLRTIMRSQEDAPMDLDFNINRESLERLSRYIGETNIVAKVSREGLEALLQERLSHSGEDEEDIDLWR